MLTTLAKLKLFLGLSTDASSDDPMYLLLLEGAESAVKQYCRREFEAAERTEYFDGPGTARLLLNHRPVTAVTNVWLDQAGYYGQAAGAFAASTLLTVGIDYIVKPPIEQSERQPAMLEMITTTWFSGDRAVWPTGQGNVKVQYTAGYNPIPVDLQMAVHAVVAQSLKMQDGGQALKSETLGEYQYEILTGAEDMTIASARRILNRYREVTV